MAPGIGDSGAQLSPAPSLPGTSLPNILCGNHACWPHLVLLVTINFPLLIPDAPTWEAIIVK
jgi:hypothetical protein